MGTWAFVHQPIFFLFWCAIDPTTCGKRCTFDPQAPQSHLATQTNGWKLTKPPSQEPLPVNLLPKSSRSWTSLKMSPIPRYKRNISCHRNVLRIRAAADAHLLDYVPFPLDSRSCISLVFFETHHSSDECCPAHSHDSHAQYPPKPLNGQLSR